MLTCIDSHEIAEWRAFEKAFGPLRDEWRDEALASIHEQLQLIARLIGQGFFGEESPVTEFAPVPRPAETFLHEDEVPAGTDEDAAKSKEEKELREKMQTVSAMSAWFN